MAKKAYFSSERFGGEGDLDLYFAYFQEPELDAVLPSYPKTFIDYENGEILRPEQVIDTASIEQEIIALPTVFFMRDQDAKINDKLLVNRLAPILTDNPDAQAIINVYIDQKLGAENTDIFLSMRKGTSIANDLIELGVGKEQNIGQRKWCSISNSYPTDA